MLPTTAEWILIGTTLFIVILASRLGDIGDALGRIFRGKAEE